MEQVKVLYTIKEVAEKIGMSYENLNYYCKKGKVPFVLERGIMKIDYIRDASIIEKIIPNKNRELTDKQKRQKEASRRCYLRKKNGFLIPKKKRNDPFKIDYKNIELIYHEDNRIRKGVILGGHGKNNKFLVLKDNNKNIIEVPYSRVLYHNHFIKFDSNNEPIVLTESEIDNFVDKIKNRYGK